MRQIIFLLLIATALTVTMTDCKSSKSATTATPTGPYMPTEEIAKTHGMNLAELTKGREIFTMNCAKCHKLKDPAIHDHAGWEITLGRMAPKAKLSDAETKLVLNYLSAAN